MFAQTYNLHIEERHRHRRHITKKQRLSAAVLAVVELIQLNLTVRLCG